MFKEAATAATSLARRGRGSHNAVSVLFASRISRRDLGSRGEASNEEEKKKWCTTPAWKGKRPWRFEGERSAQHLLSKFSVSGTLRMAPESALRIKRRVGPTTPFLPLRRRCRGRGLPDNGTGKG